jgi:hypothetical protein
MSEPWTCEKTESHMAIEEYEKLLCDVKCWAREAEKENAMLKECIVRMAMERYGVRND